MNPEIPRSGVPAVSPGNYLPTQWPSGTEDYEGMHSTRGLGFTLHPEPSSMPMLQQTAGSYSMAHGKTQPAEISQHPRSMTTKRTASSRKKSMNAKKGRGVTKKTSKTATVGLAQGDMTTAMSLMQYIPNSSGLMMPEGSLTIPHTLHSYPGFTPQDAFSSPTQKLSHAHLLPPLYTTTELPHDQPAPLPINTSCADMIYPPTTGTVHCDSDFMLNFMPPCSTEGLTFADWNRALPDDEFVADPSSTTAAPNCSTSYSALTNEQLQTTAQQLPPVSSQVSGTHASYSPRNCQNQITSQIQDQHAPPQVAEKVVKSPSPCKNVSHGDPEPPITQIQNNIMEEVSQSHLSPSVTTMAHHSVTGSSQSLTSTDEVSGAVTTQVTTDSAIAHKQDQQLPAACPSPVSQSDSDECCNDSPTPTPAQACPSHSISPSFLDSAIEKMMHNDLCKEDLEFLNHYCIARKRKPTTEGNDDNTEDVHVAHKRTKKPECLIQDIDEFLVPLVLMNYRKTKIIEEQQRALEALEEGQRKLQEGQRDILQFLRHASVKKEDQFESSCLVNEIKEESNGIKKEECLSNCFSIKSENPCQYALKLLEEEFTVEERAKSCYKKCPDSRTSKPPLPEERVKKLENTIIYRYGNEAFLENEKKITKKCDQKCRDAKKKT